MADAPKPVLRIDTHDKVVALTFDDGPSPLTTAALLDVLEDHGVPATFFLVGQHAARAPELVERIGSAGHAIGNHTSTHLLLTKLTPEDMLAELKQTHDLLSTILGWEPKLFRPPYGAHNQQLRDLARWLGYEVILWSVDPRDWEQPGSDVIVEETLRHAEPGSIILLHDGPPNEDRRQSVAAASRIIERLREAGYGFCTVPDLLAALHAPPPSIRA